MLVASIISARMISLMMEAATVSETLVNVYRLKGETTQPNFRLSEWIN
jgi:hypothetical protein